ncbi:MAG: galactosyltransferase-related protein [Patescibacteria group bacterium]|nr:galactosyltransferase-related protein [Patescibacteria group bacterium]
MESPAISVIFGTGGEERHKYLDLVMDSFFANNYPKDVEYILIEADNQYRVKEQTKSRFNIYKHIIPRNPFDIYWIFNIAAKFSSGNILIFHDNDVVVPKCFLSETEKKIHSSSGIGTTWKNIVYLGKGFSDSLLRGQVDLSEVKNSDKIGRFPSDTIHGGSIWVKRDSFFKIKGFPELFKGWGCRDDAFWLKSKSCVGWEDGSLMDLYHLYHARCGVDAQGARSTNPYYSKNRELLENMDNWTKDDWKQHIKGITEWGEFKS